MKPGPTSFTHLLEAMTRELPFQQLRLNHEFRDRLDEFVKLVHEAGANGNEELIKSIAPRALTLDQVECSAALRAEYSEEKQSELRVQLLNLGYRKRYAYSSFSEVRLQITARRIPAEPGK